MAGFRGERSCCYVLLGKKNSSFYGLHWEGERGAQEKQFFQAASEPLTLECCLGLGFDFEPQQPCRIEGGNISTHFNW